MQVVVEVSMYPLEAGSPRGYTEPIDRFLEAVNAAPGVEVTTNRMSTILFGDYEAVMAVLTRTMRAAHETDGAVAFVTKVIPGAERAINGYV